MAAPTGPHQLLGVWALMGRTELWNIPLTVSHCLTSVSLLAENDFRSHCLKTTYIFE